MLNMSASRLVCRIIMIMALLMSAAALTGCGGSAPSANASQPASTVDRSASTATGTANPATGVAPGATQDTTAASLANQNSGQKETVHSTSIATVRLVSAVDGKSVQIWVDNVKDLYAVDLEIKFDATKLRVADADPRTEGIQIRPGQVPAPDFVAINNVDNQKGLIRYVTTQLGETPPFSGSGLVATIAWQRAADKAAVVFLAAVILVNQDARPIEASIKQ
jgi:hypothetical protein